MMGMASVSLVFLKKYLDLAAASGSLDTSDYLARICGRQRSVNTFPDGSVQFDVQAEEASKGARESRDGSRRRGRDAQSRHVCLQICA